jgi:hypothetical protein
MSAPRDTSEELARNYSPTRCDYSWRFARTVPDQGRSADSDTDVLLSLLRLIFPHLALAPYMRCLEQASGSTSPVTTSRLWPCADLSRCSPPRSRYCPQHPNASDSSPR